jgi:hypothetical protein
VRALAKVLFLHRSIDSRRRTVAFSGNFGSEIQIGNQQVLGKTWVKKLVINKFSLGKK